MGGRGDDRPPATDRTAADHRRKRGHEAPRAQWGLSTCREKDPGRAPFVITLARTTGSICNSIVFAPALTPPLRRVNLQPAKKPKLIRGEPSSTLLELCIRGVASYTKLIEGFRT